MRLWTIHPRYLDAKGLVAAWREALLAQKVLQGGTRGYINHSQLIRFREQPDPQAAIASFLVALAEEATRRGYRFDASKIAPQRVQSSIAETSGQLQFEWQHLLNKLEVRDPVLYQRWSMEPSPQPHPLFHIVPGGVKGWEKI